MTDRFAGRPDADLAYPRQVARTRDFTSGRPRTFTVAPDGSRVVFLRSRAGDDPMLCLWVLDVATGEERVIFDPSEIPVDEVALTAAERARRERMRERSTGVVDHACDRDVLRAVFVESGRLLVADLVAGGARELEVPGVPDDPRLSSDGTQVAFVVDGALWVRPTEGGSARRLTPEEPEDVRWGLAEFAAAEELDRRRGYWWSPDGRAIAVARVDERPVERWWIERSNRPHRRADRDALSAGRDGQRDRHAACRACRRRPDPIGPVGGRGALRVPAARRLGRARPHLRGHRARLLRLEDPHRRGRRGSLEGPHRADHRCLDRAGPRAPGSPRRRAARDERSGRGRPRGARRRRAREPAGVPPGRDPGRSRRPRVVHELLRRPDAGPRLDRGSAARG